MGTPIQDDSALNNHANIIAARNGSAEAMGQLMESCRRYLLLVANRELHSELRAKGGASDLVQETFLEAQRDFVQFEGATEAELLAWLRRLLLNNLANFSRRYRETSKRKVGREVPLDGLGSSYQVGAGLSDGAQSPSQCAIAAEESQAMLDALDRLPATYREVILLHHRDNLTYAQIGTQLNRTPEAVRKLWSRAIERLQQELDSPHGDG